MTRYLSGFFNTWPSIFFATLLLSLVGCATTFTPFPISCSGLTVPVADTENRELKKFFSILPPKGSNWCVRKSTSNAIEYGTSSIIGTYIERVPTREDFSHTVLIIAVPLKFKETDVSTLESIKKALETWAEGKEKTQIKDDGSWYVELVESPRGKRFNLVHYDSYTDKNFKENCVRWESKQEETDNPKFPRKILKLNNAGILCRHPDSESTMIHIYFTERYLTEREDLQYSIKVRQEAERTLQSLEFINLE